MLDWDYRDAMARGYAAAVVWLPFREDDADDTELSVSDLDDDAIRRILADVTAFYGLAVEAGCDPTTMMSGESCGQDFYLTRARHGTGFWDRGLGDAGRVLTELAHTFSEDSGVELWADGTVEYVD